MLCFTALESKGISSWISVLRFTGLTGNFFLREKARSCEVSSAAVAAAFSTLIAQPISGESGSSFLTRRALYPRMMLR
jgi:hypothetical protein